MAAKRKPKAKPGRDFRGFKQSTGEYDTGPGPVIAKKKKRAQVRLVRKRKPVDTDSDMDC